MNFHIHVPRINDFKFSYSLLNCNIGFHKFLQCSESQIICNLYISFLEEFNHECYSRLHLLSARDTRTKTIVLSPSGFSSASISYTSSFHYLILPVVP